jgi:enoyl-CoA hydratase
MPERYARYQRLQFDRPHPRVLRVTMHNPGRLNSADAIMHRELVEIWRDIDGDAEVSAAILTGAGKAFSAGGDFDMIGHIIDDFTTRAGAWKEARDLVYNLICGLLADVSIASKDARIIDGHTRLGVAAGDHAAIIWPLLCGMAKAKYHLLLCEPLSGAEAERIGLISLAVEDTELDAKALEIATRLADGAPNAIRWTKYALNNWLRAAGPIFDTSLALEFLGFSSPDVREGLASHREKRKPRFSPESPL